jgi:hypothetical protein
MKIKTFGPKKNDENVHKLERERKEKYKIGNTNRRKERLWKRRQKERKERKCDEKGRRRKTRRIIQYER